MRATKLRGPAIGLALALVSGALLLGQDPPVRTPPAPGPHPLQSLGRPVAAATAERPGLDVLVWRRSFATLSSAEFRGARKGTDVVLQGRADAMEALLAIDADTSPSSIVLSLAADRDLALGVDGAASGFVAGEPVRVSATFYQSRNGALVRVPGGFVVSGTQIALWAERGAAREPLIVSVKATFGGNPPAMSAVAAFGVAQLSATLQVDADGNSVGSPGDTLRYQLRIPNIGDAAMANVAANLPLDPLTAAVAGSLNVSPIALDQAVTTNEDTPLPITLTGSDADGNALTYTVVTQPAHGGVAQASPGGAAVTYTPAGNYNGPDSFTVRNNDGRVNSNEIATIAVTVGPVNDPPSFTKGADQSVAENSAAQSVPGWATAISTGPADESAQTIAFEVTGNTAPALFSVAPAVSSSGTLTYTPAPTFSGTATISIRARDSGGTASGGIDVSPIVTFTVAVRAVNEAPSFTKGADQTVLEDSGAHTVASWATGISPGVNEVGQAVTFEITANNNSGLFAVAPAVASNGTLTFTPAANANGDATITLRARDDGGTSDGGVDVSAAQTFAIHVTAVNDAPSFTKGADQTSLEDSGAHTRPNWATAISTGPADEASQTLTFAVTNNTNAALFAVAPAVSPAGTLTYTFAANMVGTATITLQLSDSGGTANGGADTSAAQTFVLTTTEVNDPPSFAAGANQAVLEDAGAQTVAGWATALSPGPNEAGQVLTFTVTSNNNPTLFAVAPAVDGSTGTLTYTTAPNANGSATITLRIGDDGGTADGGVNVSPTQTFVIDVTAVNDAPAFTKGADRTVLEDSVNTVPGWATAISAGGADESGQTLTFVVTNNTNATLFSAGPAIAANGTLTFTPAANAFGTATITLRLDDDGGTLNGGQHQSPAQTFDITVTNVNDPPSFTKGADQTVLEDAGPQTANPWATAISAGPNEGAQAVSFEITGNSNTALFSAGPLVSSTGVLTYTPAANANGTATITLRLTDNGGTADGGVSVSGTQTFVINVTAENDAPTADDDAYSVNEAATLNVPAPGVLDGDNDVEGTTLATTLVSGPAHASAFTLNADGSFSYTHDGSETPLSDTFTYRATDGSLTSNLATVTITITAVNDAPIAGADAYAVNEGATLTQGASGGVLLNDADAEGSPLTASLVTGPAHAASFALNPDGSFSYTHDSSETLTDTFTYRASDGAAFSNIATVTITIAPVNDAPVIDLDADDNSGATGGNYQFTFTEGDPATVLQDPTDATITDSDSATLTSLTVRLTNRLDPGFEVLDVDLVTGGFNADFTKNYDITTDPAQGVLTITATTPQPVASFVTLLRRVTYSNTDPGPNPASRIVTFVTNDGLVNSAAATTTVTVISLNDTPFADADAYAVNEGGTINQAAPGVLANDTDADGDALTVALVSGPAHAASFTLNPDGSFTYVHDGDGFAPDTFTYRANDGLVDSNLAIVTINPTSVNDAPSFTKGADVTVLEDSGAQSVTGWATAINPGGAEEVTQVLTFVVTGNTNPALFAAGPAVDPATGTLTFTPAANTSGVATFALHLEDNGGIANGGDDDSPVQTVTITVTPVNDAPSFTKGADQTVLEDAGPQTVNPWATAISAGPNEGSQTVAFEVTSNTNAALFSAGPVVSPTGVLTYTPAANANGSATITLRITDDGGTLDGGVAVSATQTFVIDVTAVNDTPVADADAYNVNEGATLTVSAPGVLDGDTDVEGTTLTAVLVTGPLHGGLVLNPDGSFSYVHDGSETPLTDSFTYRASDGDALSSVATVTITINPVNDAPIAGDNAYGVNEGGTLTQLSPGVLVNDTDAEGTTLAAVLVSGPAHASSFTLNADGSFSYVHDGSETPLTDSFTYRASDGDALSNVATVTITITPVNDAPVVDLDADDSSGATGANYQFTFTEGDPATFLQDATDAVITDADHTTLTSLTVRLTNRLDPGFEVLDVDLTGFPAFSKSYDITTVPAQGLLTITASPAQPIADFVTLLRRVTYTNPDLGPDPADRIVTFVVNDGVTNSAAATTTITMITLNNAPVAFANSFGINEGATRVNLPPGVLGNDSDADGDALTAVLVTGPSHASSFTLNPDGGFTYVHDGNGAATDFFTYRAYDGIAYSNVASVTVAVTSVNDAPSFTKGADVTVLEDSGAHTTTGWATALDPGGAEESGQALTFVVTSNSNPTLFSAAPAVNGTTGTLTFTPAANAFGSATITLRLDDNGGTASGGVNQSPTQTFVITVTGVNDAPSFTKGADQTVLEDAAAQSVTAWATAISAGPNEGSQTVAFEITNNTNAALFSVAPVVSPTGVLTYTPAANANGTAAITLRITDNGGTADSGVNVSATQTFNVNVTAVNDAPSFTKGPDVTVLEDSGLHIAAGWATDRSAGPSDEATQVLTFTVTNNTNPSLFSSQPGVNTTTGTLTFAPAANANGSATITLRLGDNGGTLNGGVNQSPTQTFVITVTGINDAPSFTKGADQTVLEDAVAQSVTGWATAISAGPNESGQVVSFEITNNTNTALFSAGPAVSATGVLTYTPAANANGTAAVTLRITDDGGTSDGGVNASATQSFNITVTAVNDAPSYTAGATQTVLEDSGAQSVPGWATAISAGPANESSQILSFNITGSIVSNSLTFTAPPSIDPATGTLTYTPAPNAHGNGTFTVTLSDDGGTANSGVNSVAHSLTIHVTAVNDAPTFTPGANQTSNEDAGAQSVTSFLTAITSGPNESGQTVTFPITGNTNAGLFTVAPAISSAGTLTYTAAPNLNGVATISYHATDNGGVANSGVDTSTPDQTFTITVNPVNDPPTVANKNYSAQTNMPISFGTAAGLLNGATDADNGVNGCSTTLTVVNIAATTPLGGVVTLDNADGSFTFTPPPGVTGNVTFTYQVQDDGCPGTATSAPVTVTVNVTGPVIWFVDDDAAAGGNGTLGRPFDTLAGADAVDAANHRVFLYNGTYATGLTLNPGEWLVSQGASAATFDAFMSIAPPTGTMARPAMGPVATSATVQGTVTMGTNGVLNGIAISTAGNGFVADVTGFTVVNTSVTSGATAISSNAGNPSGTATFISTTSTGGAIGILLNNVAGAWSLGSGGLTNNTGAGFVVTNSSATTPTITYSGNINPNATGRLVDIGSASASSGLRGGSITLSGLMGNTSGSHAGIRVRNSTAGTLTFSNTVNGTTASSGIGLTFNPGATVAFNGAVTLSTGAGAAFSATGGGTVTTNAAVVNTISTSTGQPLLLTTITGPQTWRSISASGATNGISVGNLTGAFTVTGTGTPGTGGTLTNITNRGASFVTVSGAVSLSNMNFTNAGSSDGPGGPGCQEPIGGDTTACNAALHLQSTSGGVSLTSVHVDGGAQVGINGLNVTNLTMNSVEVENVGNNSLENGVLLKNTFGTGSITNSSFHANAGKQIYMYNNTGTLSAFNITDSLFSDTAAPNGAQGVLVYADGASTTMTVSTGTGPGDGNQFSNLFSFAWHAVAANNAQLTANLRNATITNSNSMVVQASLGSHITTTIDSNNWTAGANTAAGPIALKTDGGGDMNATVTSNLLGQNGVPFSGTPNAAQCGNCVALFINPQFDSDSDFDIRGNTFQGMQGQAIYLGPGGSDDGNAVRATITGNLIRQPSATSTIPAVEFRNGLSSGPPADNSCLQLTFGGSNAVASPSLAAGAKNTIDGVWNSAGAEVFLWRRFSTVFNLVGLPAPTTSVASFVGTQNNLTGGATATQLSDSSVNFGNGSCTP